MLNENWYDDCQLNNLVTLYKSIKELTGSIIEIGCWEGKSSMALANVCFPETLICNDTWLGNQVESELTGKVHATEIILKTRDVYKIFTDNMNNFTKSNYTVVKDDCLKWLPQFKQPLKFCHIDASHEYFSVKKTIEILLPLVVPNGILCGDDFLTSNIRRTDLAGGVERAVRETLPNFKNIGNLWFWKKEV